MMYGHMSPNAERVLRLAMELEQQPWAVHVKAIPTATVPVIKILADPSRLPGAVLSGNGEWLLQHAMVTQSTPVNTQTSGDHLEPNATNQNSMPQFSSQNPLPWRGADVVNGLHKVDITFEGPEHGGIGSTKFSNRKVQEFSTETGLPPDRTPAVQVLMVLKELLAQRRLNEPFSGGLSSYALLLLVISVIRERSIIRKELERVERQRRVVAAGGGNAIPPPKLAAVNAEKKDAARSKKVKVVATEDKAAKAGNKVANASKSQQIQDGSQNKVPRDNKKDQSKPARPKLSGQGTPGSLKRGGASSSWASIARKSAPPLLPRRASQGSIQSTSSEKKTQANKAGGKVSSFADAVANGTPGGATAAHQAGAESTKSRTKKNDSKSKTGGASSDKKETQPKEKKAPATAAAGPATKVQGTDGQSATNKQTVSSIIAYNSESFFPQSFHDVIEVLCSGETTSGKLLMHFLLFYGQHFDSQSTAVDYSSTHERDFNANNGYSVLSSYLQRTTAGSYDPMTGMLTVDPIVVYDPLEGAEANNVARSCFAWSSIRWAFAQSYMTLSSAVEMSASHSSDQSGSSRGTAVSGAQTNGTNSFESGTTEAWTGPYGHDESGNVMVDPSSQLLELLLAF
jgi:hypothetical protein